MGEGVTCLGIVEYGLSILLIFIRQLLVYMIDNLLGRMEITVGVYVSNPIGVLVVGL